MKNFKSCFSALMRQVRPAAPGIALCCAISLCGVACSLAFVWISKKVVDTATGPQSVDMLPSVLAMAVIMLLQILFSVSETYCRGKVVINNKNKIRLSIFDKALRSTWLSQEKFHSADVSNRLEEDIRLIIQFICEVLPHLIVTTVQLVASTAYLFILAPQLGWILIWIMPVAVVASRLYFGKIRKLSSEIRSVDGRIQGHVQESLQHRILSKTIGSEESVEYGLDALQQDEKTKTVERLGYSAISHTFMRVGFAAGYLAAFLWGAYGLRNGTATYGLMVAFLQLVSQVQRPVANIASYIPSFIHALASQERLMEISELPQEQVEEDIPMGDLPGIRLSGVGFSYPGRETPVFGNLNFDFEPGKLSVICGPTGEGKSTLAQLILALLKPDRGSVEIYNSDNCVPVSPGVRCNFMYVPQGNSLVSGTIRDNLLMASPDASDDELKAALHTAVADFVLELPDGMDTMCNEIGRGLSEGQAQRISIARALLHKGGILILDEATSALDEATETEFLGRLREETSGKKTIICITHRPAAVSVCDAVLNI